MRDKKLYKIKTTITRTAGSTIEALLMARFAFILCKICLASPVPWIRILMPSMFAAAVFIIAVLAGAVIEVIRSRERVKRIKRKIEKMEEIKHG